MARRHHYTVPAHPFAPSRWKTSDGILPNQMSSAPEAWRKTLTIQGLPRLSAIPGRGAKLVRVHNISNYL